MLHWNHARVVGLSTCLLERGFMFWLQYDRYRTLSSSVINHSRACDRVGLEPFYQSIMIVAA